MTCDPCKVDRCHPGTFDCKMAGHHHVPLVFFCLNVEDMAFRAKDIQHTFADTWYIPSRCESESETDPTAWEVKHFSPKSSFPLGKWQESCLSIDMYCPKKQKRLPCLPRSKRSSLRTSYASRPTSAGGMTSHSRPTSATTSRPVSAGTSRPVSAGTSRPVSAGTSRGASRPTSASRVSRPTSAGSYQADCWSCWSWVWTFCED